jgi:hypothetical protein
LRILTRNPKLLNIKQVNKMYNKFIKNANTYEYVMCVIHHQHMPQVGINYIDQTRINVNIYIYCNFKEYKKIFKKAANQNIIIQNYDFRIIGTLYLFILINMHNYKKNKNIIKEDTRMFMNIF